MNEQQLRQEVVEYGIRLLSEDLVQGTWGNISVRLDDDHMLVTPSGRDYDTLKPEDIVCVTLSTLIYTGALKPTSEKTLHQRVYLARPDVNAIVHTHSDDCSVLAAARVALPYDGGVARMAKYALPGTDKLAKNTLLALGKSNACLMANHGAVCCGADLLEAYNRAAALEKAAGEYIKSMQQ